LTRLGKKIADDEGEIKNKYRKVPEIENQFGHKKKKM
jgi:hypothetical protein